MSQIYADIYAVAMHPSATPAIDWDNDMSPLLDGWGPSPWRYTVTGHNSDLPTMRASCCDAMTRHLRTQHSPPTGALLMMRWNGTVLRLKQSRAFYLAIRGVLDPNMHFIYGTTRDPALPDALRVTVVTDAGV